MASTSYFFFTPPEPIHTSRLTFLRGWLPVMILLSLFCLESTAMLGADHTSAPLHQFTRALAGGQASVDSHWSMIHHLIRKTGHFLGYGVLSLAWLRALMLSLRPGKSWTSLSEAWQVQMSAVAATFAVAALDELHQSSLPNRTGKFSDVLLDTAGALALQMAMRLAGQLVARIQTQHAVYRAPAETVAA